MVNPISTKLFIAHPTAENCSIVGILEQKAPEQPTRGRKIALVCYDLTLLGYPGLTSGLFSSCARAQILHGTMGYDMSSESLSACARWASD